MGKHHSRCCAEGIESRECKPAEEWPLLVGPRLNMGRVLAETRLWPGLCPKGEFTLVWFSSSVAFASRRFIIRSVSCCVSEVAEDPQELTSLSEGRRCDDAPPRVLYLLVPKLFALGR